MAYIVPFFDDSLYLAPRRKWDLMDIDPWAHHNPSLHSLGHLFNQLERAGNNDKLQVSKDDGKFHVALDVRGYKPEELTVSVEDGHLTMSGKHEERSKDGKNFVSRQFTRSFMLPKEVEVDQIKSTLARDGRTLQIVAPMRPPAIEEPEKPKEIPIQVHFKQPIEHQRVGSKA